jgi:hypothetical protein
MTAIPAEETRFLGDSSALDNTIPILDMISPENFEREDIPSCLAACRACPRFRRARQLQSRRNSDLRHLAYRGARQRRGGVQLPQHLPSSRQQAGAGWRGLSGELRLWRWGPSGSGKSTLLRAARHRRRFTRG